MAAAYYEHNLVRGTGPNGQDVPIGPGSVEIRLIAPFIVGTEVLIPKRSENEIRRQYFLTLPHQIRKIRYVEFYEPSHPGNER